MRTRLGNVGVLTLQLVLLDRHIKRLQICLDTRLAVHGPLVGGHDQIDVLDVCPVKRLYRVLAEVRAPTRGDHHDARRPGLIRDRHLQSEQRVITLLTRLAALDVPAVRSHRLGGRLTEHDGEGPVTLSVVLVLLTLEVPEDDSHTLHHNRLQGSSHEYVSFSDYLMNSSTSVNLLIVWRAASTRFSKYDSSMWSNG